MPFALLIVGLVVGGLCLLLALNTASAANELRRQQYAAADQSVGNEVVALENAVAASGAPGNIATAAALLGMVPAGNPAFLVVRPDRSVALMGSPGAASGYPTYVPPPSESKPKPSASKSGSASASTSRSTSASKSASRSGSTSASKSASRSNPPSTPPSTPNSTLPGGQR